MTQPEHTPQPPYPAPSFEELWNSYQSLPEGVRAEIYLDALRVQPQPRLGHQRALLKLGQRLAAAFEGDAHDRGDGGWLFLTEPELQLFDQRAVVVPDLAAWRVERLPTLPDDYRFLPTPDWVCEILSPSTARYDKTIKRDLYQRAGVPYYWLVDLDEPGITALVLDPKTRGYAPSSAQGTAVGSPPFTALALGIDDLR